MKRCSPAGLPPTWARRKDALRVLAAAHADRFGSGFEPAEVPTYRRKFVWNCSAHDLAVNPRRPPFYGSFSRTRCTFRATLCRLKLLADKVCATNPCCLRKASQRQLNGSKQAHSRMHAAWQP